ncbi:NAD(P)H-binding protein [Aquabacterium sp. G14]|uniref:NAD(P)H-binding protein n=1 Tax=Aquabacterium sp. G14 TaxID=3130164 RepID=UPI0030A24BE9
MSASAPAPHSASAPRRVLLAGATGLVGRELLRQLMADPTVGEVRALTRRPMSRGELLGRSGHRPGDERLQVCEVDFDRLDRHVALFEVDWVCCAMGTTIRKAGSQAAFRQVDFDYPLHMAQLARAQGAHQLMLVSALGADADSRVFYNRVKGELEDALAELDYRSVCVARPSLLAGERGEFRLAERLGLALGWLMPDHYKPVHAAQVAAGLLSAARDERPGWHVLSNVHLRGMR